ncbi:hypothetical protein N9S17_00705 [Candidatus Pelagibacter sp.]|nr:hypothetical protein [Candidatus Pelagibacter sp.]
MESNPYNLKFLKEKPKDYLDTEEFFSFLNENKISVRIDNLPRFADNNNIQMAKTEREGSGGSVPTIYKIPTKIVLDKIKGKLLQNNNSELGKKNVKNKEKKILEIFDNSKNKTESRTSIAEKVSISMGVPCNRKLVRRILNEKRSTKLNKLK